VVSFLKPPSLQSRSPRHRPRCSELRLGGSTLRSLRYTFGRLQKCQGPSISVRCNMGRRRSTPCAQDSDLRVDRKNDRHAVLAPASSAHCTVHTRALASSDNRADALEVSSIRMLDIKKIGVGDRKVLAKAVRRSAVARSMTSMQTLIPKYSHPFSELL